MKLSYFLQWYRQFSVLRWGVWSCVILGLCQFTSVMALKLLNSTEIGLPWTWIQLLIVGEIQPTILVLLLLLLSGLGIYECLQGGVVRLVGWGLLVSIAGFIIANTVTLIVFNIWEGTHIEPLPWLTYSLFHTLPKNSVMYHRLVLSFYGSMITLIAVPLFIAMLKMKTPNEKVLGNAHFANPIEIQKSKLFSGEGIILGKAFGKTLRLPGFEGVLVNAPTGGGKTTSIAIPNLLEWGGSCIANDLKGELFAKTSEHRQTVLNNKCYEWAPANPDKITSFYNPFYYVRNTKDLRIRDLQLIAETLIPAERIDGGFWYTSSRQLFTMLAIYLFETKGMATLAEIHDLSKQEDFISWLEYEVQEGAVQDTVFYQNAHSLLGADKDKTQKNIITDFHSRMVLFSDPLVRHATSSNDFDFRQLRKEKISIYLHIPDSDKERLKPILTLFWAQCVDVLTLKEPDLEEEPYPVLALLDEFGNMERINKLKDGTSFFRSYRIRPILIVQYFGQILSTYGQYDSKGFLNSKVRIAFTLTDLDDAKFISAAMGNTTIKIKSHGTSSGGQGSHSQNTNVQSRPLMTPNEILQMNENECLVLAEGGMPIKATKCYWYKQEQYRNWLPKWVDKK